MAWLFYSLVLVCILDTCFRVGVPIVCTTCNIEGLPSILFRCGYGSKSKAFCKTIKGLDLSSNEVAHGWKFFVSTMSFVPQLLREPFEYVYSSIVELYTICINVLPRAWDFFIARFSMYLASAILFAENVEKQFMDIVVRPALLWIVENISSPLWKCVQIFSSLGKIISDGLSYFIGVLPNALQTAMESFALAIQTTVISTIKGINLANSTIIDFVNELIKSINSVIGDVNYKTNKLQDGIDFTTSNIQDVNSNLISWASNLQDKLNIIIDKLNTVGKEAKSSTSSVSKWFNSLGNSTCSTGTNRISPDTYSIHSNVPCYQEQNRFNFDLTHGVLSVNGVPVASLLVNKTLTIIVNTSTYCMVDVREGIPKSLQTNNAHHFAFIFSDGISVLGISDTSSPFCIVYDMLQNTIVDVARILTFNPLGIGNIPKIPLISSSQKQSTQISTSNIDFVSVVDASMQDVSSALSVAEKTVMAPIAEACSEILQYISLVYSAILSGITYAFQLCSWCKLTGQSCADIGNTLYAQGVHVTPTQLGAAIHFQLTGATNQDILNSVPSPACSWGTVLNALTLHAWSKSLAFVQDRIVPTLRQTWEIVYDAILPIIDIIYTHTLSLLIQIKDNTILACIQFVNSYTNYVKMMYEHIWATFIWWTTNVTSKTSLFYFIQNDTLRLNCHLILLIVIGLCVIGPWLNIVHTFISTVHLWTLLSWILLFAWIILKVHPLFL
jgi:hypothetical protein